MISFLPTLNAILNTASLTCLVLGRWAIARKQRTVHKRLMLTAFFFSSAFLVSYLCYHYGAEQMTPYRGTFPLLYYTILFTHIPSAIAVVPCALTVLYLALRRNFAKHRRIARWVFPLWVYVSATGILIYMMLYVNL